MADSQAASVLRFFRRIAGPPGDATDAEFLRRFAGQQDEAAFTALLQRHGPMVLGVCQRVLQNRHDAEDAFQATFLVFARKARSVAKHDSLPSWLHGVALRTALKAKAGLAKRRTKERQAAKMLAEDASPTVVWADLRPVLDEEIDRLPEKFRVPFVLCYLEGKTNEEAARLIGCPKGTVLSRLAAARERLRARLTRRGITLSAGLLTAALSEGVASAVIHPLLIGSTAKAALAAGSGRAMAGLVSARVASLTEGVVRAMLMLKLRTVMGVLLAVSLVGLGAGMCMERTLATDPPSQQAQPPAGKASEDDAVAKEWKKFAGTWRVTATEMAGKKLRPGDDFEGAVIVWEADGSWKQLTGDGQTVLSGGTSAIDPAKKPKTLDFTVRTGRDGDPENPVRGIYEFSDGNTLRICKTGDKGKKRPTEFATSADSGYTLLVLERVKAEEPDIPALIRAATTRVGPGESYPVLPSLSTDMRGHVANEIAGSKAVRSAYVKLDTKARNVTWFEGLDELEKEKAVWCLQSCLCHPSADVQIRAVRSLGRLGDVKAVPFLVLYAEYMAVPVEGSEEATIHGVIHSELAKTLSGLTKVEVTVKGQDPEGLKKGIRRWRKWLCDQPDRDGY